ncbi:MAG: hypothetical protein HON23_01530 [Rickettsiales bacterium]|jgi:ATP synthase protein I|nr:hypothetical protein [Rickettsiales bacterium]
MPDSNKDIDQRLKNLSEKLTPEDNPEENQVEINKHMSYAFKISAELIAGIAIGGFIGYYCDKIFLTKPLFLIIFLLLGVAGSLLNIYRDIKNG